MEDQNKTKEELVDELMELRQRIDQLEKLESERKRMEEALGESEVRYRLLAENASDVIWTVNMNMQVTYISPSVTRLLGYTVEEAKSRMMEEVFTPASFETARRAFAEGMALENERQSDPNRSRILELELTCKDGVVVPVEANFGFLRDAMGKPVSILSIARDITERKRIEEALRESEECYRTAIEHSNDGVAIVKDGIHLFVNQKFLEIFGYDHLEEIMGKPVSIVNHPDDTDRVWEITHKRQRGDEVPSRYEFKGIRKDGSEVHIEVSAAQTTYRGESVSLAYLRDITERKQAEEALRESEEKYRALIEAAGRAGEGIIIIQDREENEGAFVFVNDQFCWMSGYSREELLGTSAWDLVPNEISVRLRDWYMRRRMGESVPGHYEAAGVRKDGAIVPLELSTVTMLWQGKTATVIYLRDVTERKQAEEDLHRSEEHARRLARESEIVAEIGRIISLTLNIEEVYGHFAEEVRKLVPCDRIAIDTINFDDRTFTVAYVWGVEVENRIQGDVTPLLGTATEEVVRIQSGLIIQAEDENEILERFPGLLTNWRAGLRSMIIVPLISKNQVIGTLHLRSLKRNVYTERDLRLAERVGNQIAGAIANSELFSEAKRAEEALQESHKELQLTLDATTDSIWKWNFETNEILFSHRYYMMLGYQAGEFPANDEAWKKLIHPADLETALGVAEDYFKTKSDTYENEFRLKTKKGDYRWIHTRARVVERNERGEAVRMIGNHQDITERKRAEEELRSSREQLRALSARLQSVREEERSLLAGEIHDELGQALTGLKIDLSWLGTRLPKDQKALIEKKESMLKLLDDTIQSVRRISTQLRPGVLDDLGLIAAIEWQTEDFQNRTRIKCKFTSSLRSVDLDRDCSTGVFRIFQEALTNVARHAAATQVNISLAESAGNLILKVMDNGTGIAENHITSAKSLGLLGMRERAILFEGEVEIRGIPEKGTTVSLRIPMNK